MSEGKDKRRPVEIAFDTWMMGAEKTVHIERERQAFEAGWNARVEYMVEYMEQEARKSKKKKR